MFSKGTGNFRGVMSPSVLLRVLLSKANVQKTVQVKNCVQLYIVIILAI